MGRLVTSCSRADLVGKEKEPFPDFLQSSFSLAPHLADQIAYAIAHCSSPQAPTLDALLRTRRYLKSIGRYGSGAFLIGQYGGAGEIAQGFCRCGLFHFGKSRMKADDCRACAVFGGTYVLGKDSIPEKLEVEDGAAYPVKVKIPCHPRTISTKHLISSPDQLSRDLRDTSPQGAKCTTAHCIALLPDLPAQLRRPDKVKSDNVDEGEEDEGQDDTAVIVFPPQGDQGLVRALVMGEGTGSCPSGQCESRSLILARSGTLTPIVVLYLSSETTDGSDPLTALQPFLLRLSPEPLFQSYYTTHSTSFSSESEESSGPVIQLCPYGGQEGLTEGLDWEAEQGEKAFWRVVGGKEGVEEGKGFFQKTEADEPDGDDEL